MPIEMQTRTIIGENQFTNAIGLVGQYSLSIAGTWVGIVTIQRRPNAESTWVDIDTWTINTQEYGLEPEGGAQYRIGIKSGDYTSGVCKVMLNSLTSSSLAINIFQSENVVTSNPPGGHQKIQNVYRNPTTNRMVVVHKGD